MSTYRPGYIEGKTKAGFYIDPKVQQALKVRAAQTGESMSEIAERALRRELGMMLKIDVQDYLTTYSEQGQEYEAIQLPWTVVESILGAPHTGAAEEDTKLIDALRASGAPDWVQPGVEGWVDEHGWGIFNHTPLPGPEEPARNLEIVYRAQADTDWSIGYLDGRPALGDHDGCWYEAPADVAVRNPYQGYVWFIKSGRWQSLHASQWRGDTSQSDEWTAGGPVHSEGA